MSNRTEIAQQKEESAGNTKDPAVAKKAVVNPNQGFLEPIKGIDAYSLVKDAEMTASKLPRSPYPWDVLGKAALSQHKIDLAIDAFGEASKRTPHRASYYAFLAQCLVRKGDLTAARENIDKALMWYPLRPEYISMKEKILEVNKKIHGIPGYSQ